MSNKAFTLLEVVVALTIFAAAMSVIIKIQYNNISKIENSLESLKALRFFKEKIYPIPLTETLQDSRKFEIKEKRKEIYFGIKEIKYKIIKSDTGKTILEITQYEK